MVTMDSVTAGLGRGGAFAIQTLRCIWTIVVRRFRAAARPIAASRARQRLQGRSNTLW